MPKNNPTTQKLIELAEPVCTDSGYELVDLVFRREQNGWVVRVFIDKPSGVSFSDCEVVSRDLSAVFDVEDPVDQAYALEVSSPGVDRPLRTRSHFEKFAGERAKIKLNTGVDGRKNYNGILAGVVADGDIALIVINVDGTDHQVPLTDIASAHIIPDWDKLMKAQKAADSGAAASPQPNRQ